LPLCLAARRGQTNLVRYLLYAGASPTRADGKGQTAIDYARENDREDILKMLRAAVDRPAAP
jgi:ankyrin repeat protein